VDVPWNPTQHAIEKNLTLLSAIAGSDVLSPEFAHPRIPTAGHSRLFAIHPDAGTDAKKWPPSFFVQTIKNLLGKGHKIVLVGLDKKLGEKISGEFGSKIENKMGKTNLEELVSILGLSDGLLTNDSGPAHLMTAIGKPVWVIWSGTADPAIWAPRGKEVTIISHSVPCAPCSLAVCPIPNHPCLTSISPDEVVNLMCKTLP
jgi:ADP-heptose:LPS heptosyltransferase